ncbi:MAG: anthranilate synthase component I family protein [Thermoplasmata archaeon]
MNDPWEEFVRRSRDGACAGYIERGDAPGIPGRWATSFVEPRARFPIGPRDTTASLEDRTARTLRGRKDRALIGYIGFDAVSAFEPLLRKVPPGTPFPIGEFAVIDRLHLERVPRRSMHPVASRESRHPGRPLHETLPQRRFERAVRRARAAVGDGEAFQVVVATRRSWPRPANLLERAGRLRAVERFAYFYYLRFDDREIVGASPESALEVRGGRAYISPIAGTLPRGRARRGRRALEKDPKELAEHRMLVDLARNDLGRISEAGTVRILSRERRERFARLEHLISRVGGRLRPEVGPWEALAATFPAGTVSGAPKIRATQVLRQQERTWRGPYGGAVGLLRGNGDAAWALSIRTAFAAAGTLHTAAGAGIVWQSQPRREYREVLAKLAQVESTLVGDAR